MVFITDYHLCAYYYLNIIQKSCKNITFYTFCLANSFDLRTFALSLKDIL